ncbi:hypothetical protein SS50377_27234 [Spironucleus salmonicida]|uniref:Uncharacterized protein n=1 Tax=Spironucleus salmonicida TaxID=348837 RepID=A0A9P8RVR9_9EUKA|nr:hypothetical protein SS50377_27228 [Spironucleus salmonicida]KAH0570941.1 hypothetical protein SS50377_27234 [Spironucleus salmonicida]
MVTLFMKCAGLRKTIPPSRQTGLSTDSGERAYPQGYDPQGTKLCQPDLFRAAKSRMIGLAAGCRSSDPHSSTRSSRNDFYTKSGNACGIFQEHILIVWCEPNTGQVPRTSSDRVSEGQWAQLHIYCVHEQPIYDPIPMVGRRVSAYRAGVLRLQNLLEESDLSQVS